MSQNENRKPETLSLDNDAIKRAINEHLQKKGYQLQTPLSIPTEWTLDVTVIKVFQYDLTALTISDLLIDRIKSRRKDAHIVYDYSEVDTDTLKAQIKQIIIEEMNEIDQQLLIEMYEMCPDILTDKIGNQNSLKGKWIGRELYSGNKEMIRYSRKRPPELINMLRNRLFEKDIIKKSLSSHDKLLLTALEDAGFNQPQTNGASVRTYNSIKAGARARRLQINTLQDLIQFSESELRKFRHMGDVGIDFIHKTLKEKGLALKKE